MVKQLLPTGSKEAARSQGTFCRARFSSDPSQLLPVLLFHAVNVAELRETVAQPRASKIAEMP